MNRPDTKPNTPHFPGPLLGLKLPPWRTVDLSLEIEACTASANGIAEIVHRDCGILMYDPFYRLVKGNTRDPGEQMFDGLEGVGLWLPRHYRPAFSSPKTFDVHDVRTIGGMDGHDASRLIRDTAVRNQDIPIAPATAHAMAGDREKVSPWA
jgi:hypothetical protein